LDKAASLDEEDAPVLEWLMQQYQSLIDDVVENDLFYDLAVSSKMDKAKFKEVMKDL